MNKKLTIYAVALLLLATGSFFIYKDIAKNNLTTSVIPANEPESSQTAIEVVKLDCSEYGDFLSRSFVFSGNFKAEDKDSYSKKMNVLVSSLKGDCNSFGAWIDLGQYYNSVGDYDGAIFAWKTASKIEPNNFLPFHNLGNLYWLSLKDFKTAEEYYFKAISMNFDSLNSYSDLADLYLYSTKQPQKAIDLLKKGMDQSLFNNSYLFFLQKIAFIYGELGDKVNALKYNEMLFSADPTNMSAKQEIERLKSQ